MEIQFLVIVFSIVMDISNLLICEDYKELMETIFGDKWYDYGKIYQSLTWL
jgi:hypothetical protein